MISGVLRDPVLRPFVSWAPPVIVALLLEPDKAFPALVLMGIGWFSMNVIGPRLMSDTVGIHPIVVLAAALIGAKIAGIMGAIFGMRRSGHLRVLLPLLRSFAGDRDSHGPRDPAAGGTRGRASRNRASRWRASTRTSRNRSTSRSTSLPAARPPSVPRLEGEARG